VTNEPAFYEAVIWNGAWAARGFDVWRERLEELGAEDVEFAIAENGADVDVSFTLAMHPLAADAVVNEATGESHPVYVAGMPRPPRPAGLPLLIPGGDV
jgi:hypothetical protein